MKEITAYKCRCGEIYEDIDKIFYCKECGKEICEECAGFEEGFCWECNDKHINEEDIEPIEYEPIESIQERHRKVVENYNKTLEYLESKGMI